MTFSQIIYLILAVLCSALISYSMTPAVRVLAFRIGAIDVPLDHRRMHKRPVPRIGGLAIFLGFVVTTIIFCEPSPQLWTIWIGGLVLVVLGMLDDVFRLRAMLKFVVQIGTAAIAVYNGVVIDHITFAGHLISFGMWRIPITILWIVGLTNAINLIDGLDGLACGVSAISSTSLCFVVLLAGDPVSALSLAILTAACIGFFPYNRNPARIFMGDTGALFLGYTLAVLSVGGVFKLHTVISFLAPMSVFALPLLDTTIAIFRRLLSGRSPFSPDRGHLHHKLVDMGFTQKNAVRILYAISALFGLVAVVFTDAVFDKSRLTKAVIVFVAAVAILVINYLIIKNPNLRVHTGLFMGEPMPDSVIREMEKVHEQEEPEKNSSPDDTENAGKDSEQNK